jgi:hypothetical protein
VRGSPWQAMVNLSTSAAEQAALTFQAGAPVALVEAITRRSASVTRAPSWCVACHALTNLADGDTSRAMAQVPARARVALVEATLEAIRAGHAGVLASFASATEAAGTCAAPSRRSRPASRDFLSGSGARQRGRRGGWRTSTAL